MSTPPPSPRPPEQQARSRPGVTTLIIHHSITVLILVLFLSLGTWAFLTYRSTEFFATVDRAEFQAQLRPPLVEAQRQRITAAIHVFDHLHDRHPTQLQELVDAGLLLASDLYYPQQRLLWDYQSLSDGFLLTQIEVASPSASAEQDDDQRDVHH